MQDKRQPNAVFMAFGTQGDVFPVAAVAAGLANARHDYSISFITHAAHKILMRPLLSSCVTFIPISSPPVVSSSSLKQNVQGTYVPQHSDFQQEDAETSAHLSASWKLKTEERHREECLQAVDRIFGSDQNRSGDFIVINFFALEGWHLAELYQIPCAVAAPYVVPYSVPTSFERRFQAMHPHLYRCLREAMPGKVGWNDVVHWMWPLFTDRWTNWRTNHLHLSACPLTDPVTGLPILQNWPHEPLLLYGFSKEVVECPSYWPGNVHICGFWSLFEDWNDNSNSPPLELINFISESTTGPIFIGLSSIGSMGFLDNPEGMLGVLKAVLEAADLKGILFTAAHSPLDAAVLAESEDGTSLSVTTENCQESPRKLYKRSTINGGKWENLKLGDEQSAVLKSLEKGVCLFDRRLFCFSGSVPYLWLFPKCSLIIHHGGSGTTAAALQSGVPQVVCPFMFDQFYWAERMAWIGVAPEPLKKQHLIPAANSSLNEAVSSLLQAIKVATSPMMQACASSVGGRIRSEDGASRAVEVLCEKLCTR